MFDLDALLRESALPPVVDLPGVSVELDGLADRVIEAAPKRRRFRLAVFSAIVVGVLMLGAGATATAQSIWPDLLGGQPDASTAVTVARPGQAGQSCEIGVRVLPDTGYSTKSPVYVHAVDFLRSHDWSHLRPEKRLMQFTPSFAKAHDIPIAPIIAKTVLDQITDSMDKAGVARRGVVITGVVDCGLEAKK
jgi:hypothetical protein